MEFSLLFLFQMNFGDEVFARHQIGSLISSKSLLNELSEISFVTHCCVDPETKEKKSHTHNFKNDNFS